MMDSMSGAPAWEACEGAGVACWATVSIGVVYSSVSAIASLEVGWAAVRPGMRRWDARGPARRPAAGNRVRRGADWEGSDGYDAGIGAAAPRRRRRRDRGPEDRGGRGGSRERDRGAGARPDP